MISIAVKPLPGIQQLAEVVGSFAPISLAELGRAALQDRVDTKYLVPTAALDNVLAGLRDDYFVLEVGGTRFGHYSTVYYDTADLLMYHAHHNGRTPRSKVRVRSYGANQRYLELKVKTNKSRTRKVRVPLAPDAAPLDVLRHDPVLRGASLYEAGELREAISIDYTRVTLVGRGRPERITLDLGLVVSRGGESRRFPHVAIAEVKQEQQARSPFGAAMKELRLRPGPISKYCIGIAALEPSVKKNMFKRTLRMLESLNDSHAQADN